MSLRVTNDPEACDHGQWARFVREHPNGNIFQTPEMYRVFSATKNYEPIFIACQEVDSLLGVLLAVVQKEGPGVLGRLSARSIIWGGPLVLDEDTTVLDTILTEYDSIVRKKSIYTQVRNLFPMERQRECLQKQGYSFEDHLDILIDLDRPVESLWKSLHPTRRKQIERGYRRGVTFSYHREPSPEMISACYDLIATLYERIKLPFPKKDFFENSVRELMDRIGFFVLKYKGRIIGCRLALVYGRLIYDWYAGSDVNSLDKYPNDILPWEVMKWGAENGYAVFDFGGAGKPNEQYGVRDYKKKFGGSQVNFGRFENVHKPLRMRVAKAGLWFWKRIRGLRRCGN